MISRGSIIRHQASVQKLCEQVGGTVQEINGATQATDRHIDLSFRHPETWPGYNGVATTVVPIGDETSGPAIGLVAVAPGGTVPDAAAHAHGADNFRIVLRGALTMGRERYELGQFRFQEGWKPYPDEISHTADGQWLLVLMADRRGFRQRWVKELIPGSDEERADKAMYLVLAQLFGITGDCIDPENKCGASALTTTLGPTTNSGKLNGSFADRDAWQAVTSSTRANVALMGHPTSGPVVILATTEPHEIAAPRCRFETELFRLVVAGSCDIDGQIYEQGDMRIQRAGEWCGPVAAGPGGLEEIVVVGDRRHANPSVEGDVWPFVGIVRDLLGELSAA
jgi:hypothetical protein